MLQNPLFTRLGWGADDHADSEEDHDITPGERVEVQTSETDDHAPLEQPDVDNGQRAAGGDAARATTAERNRAEPIRDGEAVVDEQTVDSAGDEAPVALADAEMDWSGGAVQDPDVDPARREVPRQPVDMAKTANVEPAGDSGSGSEDRPEPDAVPQQIAPRLDLPGLAQVPDPTAQAEQLFNADARLPVQEKCGDQHAAGADETKARDHPEVTPAGADTTVTADDMERRRYSLGYDPAVGKFRETEAETAVRIEVEREVTLARAAGQDAFDWVDHNGKTYDAVGNFPARFFEGEWENLQVRILDHLEKAEFVPVDVSKFTAEQRSLVREFVDRFDGRIFVVGDE